nr:D-glycerate 2-kinase-like [Nerophis lumbriciformis]
MTGGAQWLTASRRQALSLFRCGVAAADPETAIAAVLTMQDERLSAVSHDGTEVDSVLQKKFSRIHVVAVGKAACASAAAARSIIPHDLICEPVLALTNSANVLELPTARVFGAGHPQPDAAGQQATRHVIQCLANAKHDELVLMLISGGGSALLCCPVEPISLEDKIRTNQLLLGCGASINEVNTIRKHLSQVKGGQLAKIASPASVHSLMLSDVIGDDVSTIASGPTVPDPTTYADAIAIAKAKNIWLELPESVHNHLTMGQAGQVAETPKVSDPVFDRTSYQVIGSNRQSLEAVEQSASMQRQTKVLSTALCGNTNAAVDELIAAAVSALDQPGNRPMAIIAGGETTVKLRGDGRGGRNQEMALAFAIRAKLQQLPKRWVFLSAGTDGLDGPTDAAGGMVDPWSLERMQRQGITPTSWLENNDSYNALAQSDDLLLTGATGTNVADLQILLIN